MTPVKISAKSVEKWPIPTKHVWESQKEQALLIGHDRKKF